MADRERFLGGGARREVAYCTVFMARPDVSLPDGIGIGISHPTGGRTSASPRRAGELRRRGGFLFSLGWPGRGPDCPGFPQFCRMSIPSPAIRRAGQAGNSPA
jgi:hypothetical protein